MNIESARYLNKSGSSIEVVIDGTPYAITALESEPIFRQLIDSEFVIDPFLGEEDERKHRLWSQANERALEFDRNSRERAAFWMMDSAIPQWRKDRIEAILAWSDTIWSAYYVALSQGDTDLAHDIALPYTFHQLVSE